MRHFKFIVAACFAFLIPACETRPRYVAEYFVVGRAHIGDVMSEIESQIRGSAGDIRVRGREPNVVIISSHNAAKLRALERSLDHPPSIRFVILPTNAVDNFDIEGKQSSGEMTNESARSSYRWYPIDDDWQEHVLDDKPLVIRRKDASPKITQVLTLESDYDVRDFHIQFVMTPVNSINEDVVVYIVFSRDGGRRFNELTKARPFGDDTHLFLGIVYEEAVVAALRVKGVIHDRLQISNDNQDAEYIRELGQLLRTAWLLNSLRKK